MPTMRCQKCGVETRRNSAAQKFCPDCAPDKRLGRNQVRHRGKGGKPMSDNCVKCGEPFERMSNRQKFCRDCSPHVPSIEIPRTKSCPSKYADAPVPEWAKECMFFTRPAGGESGLVGFKVTPRGVIQECPRCHKLRSRLDVRQAKRVRDRRIHAYSRCNLPVCKKCASTEIDKKHSSAREFYRWVSKNEKRILDNEDWKLSVVWPGERLPTNDDAPGWWSGFFGGYMPDVSSIPNRLILPASRRCVSSYWALCLDQRFKTQAEAAAESNKAMAGIIAEAREKKRQEILGDMTWNSSSKQFFGTFAVAASLAGES